MENRSSYERVESNHRQLRARARVLGTAAAGERHREWRNQRGADHVTEHTSPIAAMSLKLAGQVDA